MLSKRPNILFIMDDQHRFDYLGCSGAEFVRTPNLDRLAARGVRFTHCFTNAPICVPARIGLATGMQPFRLSALDNNAGLPVDTPTMYKHFRDNGYRVGGIGKFDLRKYDPYNGRYGDRPVAYSWGFTHPCECEGKMHAGSSPKPIGPYTYYLQEKGLLQQFHADYQQRRSVGWSTAEAARASILPPEDFEDCYIGRKAASWLEAVPDDFPWFLFVSFVGPHDPYDPPEPYAARYENTPVPAAGGLGEGKPRHIAQRRRTCTPEEVTFMRRRYCAAIEVIDDQIGLLLAALEKRQMVDNTIIVFTSDHGEMLGDQGLFQKNVPYEAALRVPLIFAGPGIAGDRSVDALIELIDLNPTLCELAGLPPQPHMDALSFAPLLHGESTIHRPHVISALRHFRCIRTERYKLIENYNDITELYDLPADPWEQHNIAANRKAEVNRLARELQRRTRL
ncbi:MAG: sulfatase [Limnochordia bacterium]